MVHIEAGLRTSNLMEPFPEEGNRQIISRLAAVHFAPTDANKANLIREGVDFDRIVVTGNTSIDMLRIAMESEGDLGSGLEELHADPGRRVVLITAHRRENWGVGLSNVAEAVARSCLIITDSGGVQEEAPTLGIPVLVTRTVTERREGVRADTLHLVGTDPERIVLAASRVLRKSDEELAEDRARAPRNPYGDGHAADRIVGALTHVRRGTALPDEYLGTSLQEAVRRGDGRCSTWSGRSPGTSISASSRNGTSSGTSCPRCCRRSWARR